MMSTTTRNPESLSMDALAVVLIVPQDSRRASLKDALAGPQANIVREFAEYPRFDVLTEVVGRECDVAIVDLDADAEQAEVPEGVGAANPVRHHLVLGHTSIAPESLRFAAIFCTSSAVNSVWLTVISSATGFP